MGQLQKMRASDATKKQMTIIFSVRSRGVGVRGVARASLLIRAPSSPILESSVLEAFLEENGCA